MLERIKTFFVRMNQYPNDTVRKGEEVAEKTGRLLSEIESGMIQGSKVLELVNELIPCVEHYRNKLGLLIGEEVMNETIHAFTEKPCVISMRLYNHLKDDDIMVTPSDMKTWISMVRTITKQTPDSIDKLRYAKLVTVPSRMSTFIKDGEELVDCFVSFLIFLEKIQSLPSSFNRCSWFQQYRDLFVAYIPYFLLAEDILSNHRLNKKSRVVV